MITLRIDELRKARVWRGELPAELAADGRHVIERRLEAGGPARAGSQRVALELFLPRGAMVEYGLLGAEFAPGAGGGLVVEVAVEGAEQRAVEWALAVRFDEVRAGVPAWAAEAIINASGEEAAARALGPGRLLFAWGAHGAIGSHARTFALLARAVVGLTASPAAFASEATLLQVLTPYL